MVLALLAACGPAPLPPPANALVWRFGAPCDLDRPQDCGPVPLVCADMVSETRQRFCTMTCDAATACPAGSTCQTAIRLCLKQCESEEDCAPGAVCNRIGACQPSCKVEPWACMTGVCCSDGICR